MASFAAIAVTACIVLGQAPAADNGPFKEYGTAIAGEWLSEVEVDFDYPPIVKKGDKAKVSVKNQWILNDTAISSEFKADVNGVTVLTAQSLLGWDQSAKRIVECGFDSLGGRGEVIIEKRADKWYMSGTGVAPDGRVGVGTTILRIVNKDTHELLEIGRLSPSGEPLPNKTIISKRITKN